MSAIKRPLLLLLMLSSSYVMACSSDKVWQSKISVVPVVTSVVLNSESIGIYHISSLECSLSCYLAELSKNNIEFSLQGNLLRINKNGGMTIELTEMPLQGFKGRMICKADKTYKILSLPKELDMPKAINDFQAMDSKENSRTITYENFPRQKYLSLIQSLQKRAKEMDITTSYSYFKMADSSELNFIYDSRKLKSTLILIYVKRNPK